MTEQRLIHVVDDEDAIRRSLDFMLRAAGHRVELWANGEAFLQGAEHSASACVLLDYCMPGINGLEVQARMPNMGIDFPVILVTGQGDIGVAVRAMKAGAADFLDKPFDREKLLRSVEIAFNQIADQQLRSAPTHWARARLEKLTTRELEVLKGLACGVTNKLIADDLGVSQRTVEIYRANVMTKLDVGNFADALRIAFAAGLGLDSCWREGQGMSSAATPH